MSTEILKSSYVCVSAQNSPIGILRDKGPISENGTFISLKHPMRGKTGNCVFVLSMHASSWAKNNKCQMTKPNKSWQTSLQQIVNQFIVQLADGGKTRTYMANQHAKIMHLLPSKYVHYDYPDLHHNIQRLKCKMDWQKHAKALGYYELHNECGNQFLTTFLGQRRKPRHSGHKITLAL